MSSSLIQLQPLSRSVLDPGLREMLDAAEDPTGLAALAQQPVATTEQALRTRVADSSSFSSSSSSTEALVVLAAALTGTSVGDLSVPIAGNIVLGGCKALLNLQLGAVRGNRAPAAAGRLNGLTDAERAALNDEVDWALHKAEKLLREEVWRIESPDGRGPPAPGEEDEPPEGAGAEEAEAQAPPPRRLSRGAHLTKFETHLRFMLQEARLRLNDLGWLLDNTGADLAVQCLRPFMRLSYASSFASVRGARPWRHAVSFYDLRFSEIAVFYAMTMLLSDVKTLCAAAGLDAQADRVGLHLTTVQTELQEQLSRDEDSHARGYGDIARMSADARAQSAGLVRDTGRIDRRRGYVTSMRVNASADTQEMLRRRAEFILWMSVYGLVLVIALLLLILRRHTATLMLVSLCSTLILLHLAYAVVRAITR